MAKKIKKAAKKAKKIIKSKKPNKSKKAGAKKQSKKVIAKKAKPAKPKKVKKATNKKPIKNKKTIIPKKAKKVVAAKNKAKKVKKAVPKAKKAVVVKKKVKPTKPAVKKTNKKVVLQKPKPIAVAKKQKLSAPRHIVRYSDKDLAEFKSVIESKIKLAQEDISELKELLASSTENPDSESGWNYEDSTDHAEKEHLISMIARQTKFVKNLEDALGRIESKTYGICRVSGNLIAKKRLLAVPHATMSIEAKLQENKGQVVLAESSGRESSDFEFLN